MNKLVFLSYLSSKLFLRIVDRILWDLTIFAAIRKKLVVQIGFQEVRKGGLVRDSKVPNVVFILVPIQRKKNIFIPRS